MATSDMGLFGPTPYEIQQAQQQSLQQNAAAYANQSPLQRAAQGMYQAGGMLGGMAASGLGMVNPQVEQAKRTEQIMSSGDTDIGTSAGLLAKADEFRKAGDLRMAATLTMKGKEMQKQEAAAALAARKQDFQEKEVMDFKREQLMQQAEQKKAQLEQQAEAARLRSEDSRYSAQQRAEAAKYAADARREISMLMAQVRQMGIEAKGTASAPKAMTQAGRLKQDLESGLIDQSTYDAEVAALPGGKAVATKEAAATGALGHLDNVEKNLQKIYDPVTSKLKPAATSLFGQYAQYRPATLMSQDSADALVALNGLKDQVMLANLQEAKARVGQSFGSMQLKEWDKFVNQLASLDRTQGEESAASNLKDIQNFIKNKRPVLEAALGGKGVAPTPKPAVNDFDAKWSALKSGQSLVGPDGKTYTKK